MQPIDLLFIDGYHSYDQIHLDFTAFQPKLSASALILFHDSLRNRTSRIYGETKHYQQEVRRYLDDLAKDSTWQVLDLPFADGVSIVRRRSSL